MMGRKKKKHAEIITYIREGMYARFIFIAKYTKTACLGPQRCLLSERVLCINTYGLLLLFVVDLSCGALPHISLVICMYLSSSIGHV